MIQALTPVVPTPLRPSATKRLRSCLSPTRTPSGSNSPSCRASRSASFSSTYSGTDGYRCRKSVRWNEDDEGSAVTSCFTTWSSAEYDRTPLDPPSEAERTCVLPARGSRCITSAYDCFDDEPACPEFAADDDDEESMPSSPIEEIVEESLCVSSSDCGYPEGEGQDEDKDWEECMERRRMMFAMRTRGPTDEDGQPEFDGYRSLSSTLITLLQSIEARREPSPEGRESRDEEWDDEMSLPPSDIEEEDEESEAEGGYVPTSSSSFVFAHLESLRIRSVDGDCTPSNRHDDDSTTAGEEEDGDDLTTPSLTSCSSSSEADSTLPLHAPASSSHLGVFSMPIPIPIIAQSDDELIPIPISEVGQHMTKTTEVIPGVPCALPFVAL